MSSLHDRIAQFRKMATDDPENELGHFRLGQLLAEDGQHAEAVKSFEKTIELSPQFSKVYQLLGEALTKCGDAAKAVEVLTAGYKVADERGDKMPRDAMAKQLADLGAPVPKAVSAEPVYDGRDTGFRCERPGCVTGRKARQMPVPPNIDNKLAERVYEKICMECWDSWKKDYSIKVINELRLDLSSEFGAAEYDKHLRGYLGFDDAAN